MGRIIHSSFEVKLPIERAWAVMSDTQHLNQLFFGMKALEVVSRSDAKVRIKGSFGVFAPEYDELPWLFETPRRYESVRIFPKGLLRQLRTRCELEANENGTRVDYRAEVEPAAGPLGAIASAVVAARVRAGLAAAHDFMRQMQPDDAAPRWPPIHPLRDAVMARAQPLVAAIQGMDAVERQALERAVVFIAEEPEADVARMRPYELAQQWRLPRAKVLTSFLRAADAGLMRLSWDLLCPACEGATSVASLHDLPQGGHCPACDIDFEASFDENVEATFAPEPTVRAAKRLVFCHGSPSATKAWLAQVVLQPGEARDLKLTLGVGRYRVQAAGLSARTPLEVVEATAPAASDHVTVALTAPHDGARQLPPAATALRSGPVTITLANEDRVARRVQLAHRAFASSAATAADVTALGLFRERFGQDALDPGQHVAVGRRSILFTDLVGSTAMYERLGDAAAYGLVREHFKLLFAEVERFGGAVVKTVGDSVMAAFDAPVDAARAARAMVLALRTLKDRRGEPSGLKLRVGVHTGPCLAVQANGQTDYFGRTVNIAARVEGQALADQVAFSWTAAGDLEMHAFFDQARAAGDAVSIDRRPLKGIDGEVELTRVEVAR